MDITEVTSSVKKNAPLNADTTHLVLSGSIPPYLAGQFFMLGTAEEPEHKRAYSISSAPWEKEVSFCIRSVENGKVSPKLFSSATNNTVVIRGPYGYCTLAENERDIVFLAVGTGIAPYRGMIRELFKKWYSGEGEDTTKNVHVLFGAKTKADIFYEEEFTKLAREKSNFSYTISLTREEHPLYLQGRLPVHVDQYLKEKENRDYYICGGNQMVHDMKKLLVAKGVAEENIHIEIHGVRTKKSA